MVSVVRRRLSARPKKGVAAIFLLCLATGGAHAGCQGEDGGSGVVTGVSEGDTLILDDGRAVRLAGVIGPKRARSGPASEARALMEKAVAELTLGKKVSLLLGERRHDRYGRILAQIMAAGQDGPLWVQGRIVEDGLARVISFADSRLCASELLAKENLAREAKKGFWQTGYFATKPAEAENLLFRLAQSYEIVEGEVRNVTEIKGRTYINFGENWRRDFTIFVSAQSARLFTAQEDRAGEAMLDLSRLQGRRIRVRGWLKNFNGPSIAVTHPEQIEVLDRASSEAR